MYIRLTILLIFFILNPISCQTNKIISFNKYEDLGLDRKKEVDENLKDVLEHLSKKENEIVILFQYNCFFNKKLEINGKYGLDFPKDPNEDHYGQKFKKVKKEEGPIKIKMSDRQVFIIKQQKGFDYIGVCYNEKEDKLYIEYFDYPRILRIE